MKLVRNLEDAILKGFEYVVNTGREDSQGFWQGKVIDRPMIEALDYSFKTIMPQTSAVAVKQINPNLPWADKHFMERVGGKPLNPPPSASTWPYNQKDNEAFREQGIFDHTYPERFWPRYANNQTPFDQSGVIPNQGIRFEYGDYADVINKLKSDPHTRQAFLPIWFPEDTGKPSNIRVPCSIGYHYLIRDGRIDVTYWMRSLDMLRHFRDDIYLCWKVVDNIKRNLNQHKSEEPYKLGYMKFHAVSCHVFKGEIKLLEREINKIKIKQQDINQV